MSEPQQPTFYTTGDIARMRNVSHFRVKYAIEIDHIEPVSRVGITRLFSPEQAKRIGHVIDRISRHPVGGAA